MTLASITMPAALGLAALFAAAGCVPTTPGDLQNGGFTYLCPSESDLACQDQLWDASDVPPAIAVGAHFDLEFAPPLRLGDNDVPPVTSLVPASSMLAVEPSTKPDSTGFRFLAPGTVAVLAEGSGVVVDFLHVTGEALDHVAVLDDTGDETHAITVHGYGATLQALPRSSTGETLAGALDYTWTSSDESVVTVSQQFEPNRADLTPGAPGTATVTVTAGGATTSVQVTVGGAS